MKKKDLDYRSVEVDERLLIFLPYYKQMFIAMNPQMPSLVDDSIAQQALLQALEIGGHARRRRGPDGRVRLEPTEEYLRDTSSAG
jgi:hypothetical protein